jgi:hypothetical protein
MARLRHGDVRSECPLVGEDRKSSVRGQNDAIDPKETCSEPSLDHLVGDSEQPWPEGGAERLGGCQIDDEIELGRLLDRKVDRPRAA